MGGLNEEVTVHYSPLLAYARSIRADIFGGGGPNITQVQPTSQATPLAEDFLKILQGQLSSDAFGTGTGPLQRESGTALRQFVQSLQGEGGVSEGAGRLISGIEERGEARIERGAADLREQGGILGQRFGTSLATGEALFRSEAGAELDRTVGGIQEGARQFDANLLLQSIAQLFGQGEASTDLFARFATLGIIPQEILASPGLRDQLLAGLIDAGSSFLSRSGGGGSGSPPGATGLIPPSGGQGPQPISGGPSSFPPGVVL